MNYFNNPGMLIVMFPAAVAITALAINHFRTRKKVPTDYGSLDAPLTRKERRAIQFADQSEADIESRSRVFQARFLADFKNNVRQATFGPDMSFIDAVNNLLAIAEREIEQYRNRAHKKTVAENNISIHDVYVVGSICTAIIQMASARRVNDLTCINQALMRFVESNLRIRHLNAVLYRHKGSVAKSIRAAAMARCIIEYYRHSDTIDVSEIAPFDYLGPTQMTENEVARRDFFEKAIDITYINAMKTATREPYSKTERVRNEAHENNRKQRRRRVTKSKNRN